MGPTTTALINTLAPLTAGLYVATRVKPTSVETRRQSRYFLMLFASFGLVNAIDLIQQVTAGTDQRPLWNVVASALLTIPFAWTFIRHLLQQDRHEKLVASITGIIVATSVANLAWFNTIEEEFSDQKFTFENATVGLFYPAYITILLAACVARFNWQQIRGQELNPIGLLGVICFGYAEFTYAWTFFEGRDALNSPSALGSAIAPLLVAVAFVSDCRTDSPTTIRRLNRRRGFWLISYAPIVALLLIEALGHNHNFYERVSTLILAMIVFLLIARVIITQRELAQSGLILRERSIEKSHEINRLQVLNQRIIDVSTDGIVAANSHDTIISCNPAAREILGLLPDEELPYSMHDLFHRDSSCNKRCQVSRALHPSAHERSQLDLRLAGREIIIELSVRAIDGPSYGYVVIFNDVTTQILLARTKEHIISVVSHEIRTPLTTIRGSLGLIKSGLFGKIEGEAKELMTLAIENSERVMLLVNDLLDLDKIASKRARMNFHEIDIDELLSQAVRQVSIISNHKTISISYQSDHTKFIADRDRILQVITNLLHNSIKFSPEGSNIELSSTHTPESTIFRVRDQGRGIPPNQLESIFEPFNQLSDSDSRHGDGSGLGLTICKGIVEAHGGTIHAESSPSGGATIEFNIPHLQNNPPPPRQSEFRNEL